MEAVLCKFKTTFRQIKDSIDIACKMNANLLFYCTLAIFAQALAQAQTDQSQENVFQKYSVRPKLAVLIDSIRLQLRVLQSLKTVRS